MMEEAFRLIDDPAGEAPISASRPAASPGRAQRRSAGAKARSPADIGCANRAKMPKPRSSPWARSCPKRSQHGKSWRKSARLGLLAVTSPDLLHRGWTAAQAARWRRRRGRATSSSCSRSLSRGAGLVTIADAAPASLSWLGGVLGQRVAPLGVEKFGQTGSLADLYAAYRSTASRSPKALPSCCSLIGGRNGRDVISRSGRSATRSPTRSRAP